MSEWTAVSEQTEESEQTVLIRIELFVGGGWCNWIIASALVPFEF